MQILVLRCVLQTQLEVYETPLTRRIGYDWGVEFRDKRWGITGIDFAPYKMAPRRMLTLSIEHKEV